MELLFFGQAGQDLHAGRATLNHGGHIVELTSAHFLLMQHEGLTFVACCEFLLLDHFHVVIHTFAASVSVRELEGVVSTKTCSKSKKLNQLPYR